MRPILLKKVANNLLLSIQTMSQSKFLSTFSHIYENAPWVAETVWEMGMRPYYGTISGLHSAMVEIVNASEENRQLSLLKNHPELAAKGSRENSLTEASQHEQKSAGLTNCSQEEADEFENLNSRYKSKFGFPFILAVKTLQTPEILSIFRERIDNYKEEEFNECLLQVHQIALLRLKQVFEELTRRDGFT